MRPGGIFSPLGAVEVSEEDKEAAASEYQALATQCYKEKLSSACSKKALLVGTVGPSLASLIDGCAQGTTSDCAKAQAIQGATSACTAYTTPVAAPVCGWVASKVISKAWPYLESGVSAAANTASSLLSYGLETVGFKDKPNFFNDFGNDMKAEALRRRDKLVGGFVDSVVAGIMSSRAELGIPGDRIVVHTGKEMSVRDMVWWVLNSDLDARCVNRGTKFSSVVGSYGRLWYYPCSFGANASVDLNVPVLKRKDAYLKAAAEFSRQVQGDFGYLAASMRTAINDATAQEAQNPASADAMKRAAVREAASRISALNLKMSRPDYNLRLNLAPAPVSSSEGSSGRMRLFMLVAAAAVGIGLAIGTTSRRKQR
jgi:hypothetical protein